LLDRLQSLFARPGRVAALVSLLLYLYPAIVTLLAAVFLRERLTLLKIVALVLALLRFAEESRPPVE